MRARRSAVVPAVALLAFVAGCGEDAPATTASGPTSSPPASGGSPTASTTAAATLDEETATAAVDDWLAATASGDPARVSAGLGASSLRAVEMLGGIEVLMSGLAEGMSTYAQPGLTRTAVQLRPDAWLVTYAGERSVEGTTEFSARSWIVVDEGGQAKVEAFVHPLPELESPADPAATAASDPVTVTLPAGGDALAYLDGTTPVPTEVEPVDGDQLRVSAVPEGGWPPGRHAVTVLVLPGDAGGTARASTTLALTVTG